MDKQKSKFSMQVKTDFETKHFIEYTKMTAGELVILDVEKDTYKVAFDNCQFDIAFDSFKKIKLKNQDIVIKSKILM